MSDQKYVNTYIDTAIGAIHENINVLIQTRTQLKLANEAIVEKEEHIKALYQEIEKYQNNETEANKSLQNARNWEEQYNSMKVKVSHMDTLMNQYNEVKNLLISKNAELDDVLTELKELKELSAEKDGTIKELSSELSKFLKNMPEKDKNLEKLVKSSKKPTPKKLINTDNVNMDSVPEPEEQTDDF